MVRMSRSVTTDGSRYAAKGLELLRRLHVVESQVDTLTEAAGALLRQAYSDLVTKPSPTVLGPDAASVKERLIREEKYECGLQSLCDKFKAFGLTHALLQVRYFNLIDEISISYDNLD